MRCPRCTLAIHRTAEECPHCGLNIEHMDRLYEGFVRQVGRLYDGAGVLRVHERRLVMDALQRIERAFPQLTVALATVPLNDEQNVRSYGFWLMNRGDFGERPESALDGGIVLLIVDAEQKQACIHLGYLLEAGVTEKAAFEALEPAHPYLLEANFSRAFELMLSGVNKLLKRAYRRTRRLARSHQS